MWIPRLIKQITAVVHAETSTVHKAIKEQEDAARETNKAAEAKQREVAGVIAFAIKTAHEEVPVYEKDQRDKEYRQQRKMVWATWFAFAAALAYGAVAAWQGYLMRKTYNEIRQQTKAAEWQGYMACLNARAAQTTVILSQATAQASITQARSEIEAQRSLISFTPRIPNTGEIPHQQLTVPFSIRNDGKSPAIDLDLRSTAVLLRKTDQLSFDEKNSAQLTTRDLSAGTEYPTKPVDDQHHAVTQSVVVRDTKGNIVPITDQAAQDFLSGADSGATVVFVFGRMKYSDFAGTHAVRFCTGLWVLTQGATRGGSTESEKTCARYNSSRDEYAQYPNLSVLPSVMAAPPQIPCIAPK